MSGHEWKEFKTDKIDEEDHEGPMSFIYDMKITIITNDDDKSQPPNVDIQSGVPVGTRPLWKCDRCGLVIQSEGTPEPFPTPAKVKVVSSEGETEYNLGKMFSACDDRVIEGVQET